MKVSVAILLGIIFILIIILSGCSTIEVATDPKPIQIDTVYVPQSYDDESYLAVIEALNEQLDSLSSRDPEHDTLYLPIKISGNIRPKTVFPLDTTTSTGSVKLKFNLARHSYFSDIYIKPSSDTVRIAPDEAIRKATEPYLPEWVVAILAFLAGLLPYIKKVLDAKKSS